MMSFFVSETPLAVTRLVAFHELDRQIEID